MLRIAVVAVALAGLLVLAAGVVDAVPLVFWGSHEEVASVAHGRAVMLTGAAVTLVAAAGLAVLGRRVAAALLAVATALPVGLALGADGTAFGLLVLPVALAIGVGALIAVFAGPAAAR